ncbi:PLP-dependent aminotransferase family protein [Longispora albida]|uniref:MocR-like pyridoxine biosynthesis transcription factor PdxR n=1 Tax=Longispora albida TaxID=203523 RepID=UPI00036B5795|nr:PLP-dependent aminotransferase family protein [Longispora albida]
MLGFALHGPRRGDQLLRELRAAIGDGRLAPGTRLPSSRELAADLNVSRGLVVAAYEQLTAEGWLTTRRGAGTVVALAALPHPTHHRVPGGAPHPLPLRPGVPDLALFPRAAWRRAYHHALSTVPDADLDYPGPLGAPRLRQVLAAHLGRVRSARADPANLFVTTATAQALTLLARVLPGRLVGVEDPGSAGLAEHLVSNGLTPVPVPVDCDGITVPPPGLAAVLVTPAHQYPEGVVLSPARRAALAAWARAEGALIIEDDYDAEFRYDRDPIGCVQGVAPDVTALVGSVSKALAPAVRIGWLLAPPYLADNLVAARLAADRGGPALEQLAFAALLESGGYDRHLRRAARSYRTRRDALVAAVGEHLPGARVGGVAAGLHAVITLPSEVDDVALCARALALGLGSVPLSTLRHAPGPPGLVIGFAATSPGELTAAIRTLASLVK